MKKMNTRTAEYLKNGFGSLVSNKCAIESAKIFPWWVGIILFLVFSFIPVTPIMNTILRTNGSDFISQNSYSFDKQVAGSFLSLDENGYELVINENKNIICNKTTTVETPIAEYISEKDAEHKSYGLRVYYINSTNKVELSEAFDAYCQQQYVVNTLNPRSPSDPEGTVYYTPNIMLIAPETIGVQLYKNGTSTAATNFVGDWIAFENGTSLIPMAINVDGTHPTLTEFKINPTKAYIEGVTNNWKTIFDLNYSTTKGNSLLISTFMYWGIYAGLVLFLGLLVFLLTRGKKNFNNYLKWYQCLGISFWASSGPSILALILGFILSNFAMMFFIMFVGIRVMWLTMKQLSPTYQG